MPQEQHRATARVLDILEHLAVKKEGLTLTELAQELEAPKSSLFPIVHTLEERRYLRQNRETGRYTVGSGIWILGAAFAADGGLEPIVEVMKKVVAECQETCQLGLLEKGNVLYVEKEDSPQAIRMISWVGNRLPANATAIGKALLSGLTDAEIRRLYADGLPQLTEHTITDPAVLLAQLAEVRSGGIATEREESTPQLACWAVPLHRQDKVFAALSVSVPLFRCQEDKVELVCQCLRKAQKEIEHLAEIWNFKL
ncbi:IclR family transcriptional regulator [Agathobaculum sp.]|uniref:IclR family transcriptional regulator n=1 Tax=Agathobaculum sp. TaxID=2048138 RepID=UPI0027B8F23A|nr:IclR family transcriptional regulator [Agathobaculum sp.]